MGTFNGSMAPAGDVSFKVIRNRIVTPVLPAADNVRTIMAHSFPQKGLSDEVNTYRRSNLKNIWRGLKRIAIAEKFNIPTHYGVLWASVIRGNGEVVDLGLISCRVVTDTGVGYIVDAFQNLVEMENMKFHGFGTGTTAEAASQSALVTELTTQYNPDSTRPTGSTTENAANIYRTVGTLSPDSGGTIAVTEHGVFSASSAGVMLDRSVFSAINLVASADSLQVTYDLTFTSGG